MIGKNLFQYREVDGLIQEIDQLINLDFSSLQAWKPTWNDWAVGESKSVGGSGNTKIYQDKKMMRFVTVIPPLVEFPEHWHDCIEVCLVLSGILGDKITGRTWKRDEKAVFQVGKVHTPYNPSPDTDLYMVVEFFK